MTHKIYLISLLVVLTALGRAVAFAAATTPDQAVRDFVTAGDTQNTAQMEEVLHGDFRVLFVTKGKPGVRVLSRAQFLEMLRAKKLGGDARKLTILSVEVRDSMAFVRVRIEGKHASFESLETLLQEGGRWQLVADDVVFEPKS